MKRFLKVLLIAYSLQLLLVFIAWAVPIGRRIESDGTKVVYLKGLHPVLHSLPGYGLLILLAPDNYYVVVVHPERTHARSLDMPLTRGMDSLVWDANDRCLIDTDIGEVVIRL